MEDLMSEGNNPYIPTHLQLLCMEMNITLGIKIKIMARKIFVSYKYADQDVERLGNQKFYYTAHDYVEELIDLLEGDEIYKGEGDEDLSQFKDETIRMHLKDKIYDSTITIVLISPSMKVSYEKESDQWIPWEVSYSLKEITRNNRTSKSNGMLAVVLPNRQSLYNYYYDEDYCRTCKCTLLRTNTLFQILRDNMFNIKEPNKYPCDNPFHSGDVYKGDSSYIHSVKWSDFISDKDMKCQR